MCGIFGLVQANPLDAHELIGMGRRLHHRGPDDEGYLVVTGTECKPFGGRDTPEAVLAADLPYAPSVRLEEDMTLGGGLALGFRRLAILDLSPTGHQPMSYRERFWIVFNGEIYNYLELAAELEANGFSFSGRSDTEVLLAAYQFWGQDCLNRFNGMWGLAIYDRIEQTLFLARDRFGVKPLYLWPSHGRLAFASEIKAFTGLKGWRPKGNRPRILDFLVWTLSDHSEATMFEGVLQLPQGHKLTLHLPTLLAQLERNELPSFNPISFYTPARVTWANEAQAVEGFREILTDAVKLRLRADVPVGSCLSGGLDSSSIVCIMSRLLGQQRALGLQQTFTARSSVAQFDETLYAQAVIDRTGVVGRYVTPEPDRLFKEIKELVWTQDEPFGSTSIFAQWCIFALARENQVTVMLDGQGADEILGGYRGYFGAYLAELFRGGRLGALWSEMGHIRETIGFSRIRSMGYLLAYLLPGAIGTLGRFDARAYADPGWLAPSSRWALRRDPIALAGGRSGSVRGMSLAQLFKTHLPMLLRYEDRNSMAFSIEARTPFLDYRLTEACLGMPAEWKVGCGSSKSILRKAMRGQVPDQILDRRDKMGFLTAEPVWMQNTARQSFRTVVQEAVDRFPGLLSRRLVDQYDEMGRGERPYDGRYWRAINLGLWAQLYNITI